MSQNQEKCDHGFKPGENCPSRGGIKPNLDESHSTMASLNENSQKAEMPDALEIPERLQEPLARVLNAGDENPPSRSVSIWEACWPGPLPTASVSEKGGDAKVYLPWAEAGGPNECEHGYAAGIPCPKCDEQPEMMTGNEVERVMREAVKGEEKSLHDIFSQEYMHCINTSKDESRSLDFQASEATAQAVADYAVKEYEKNNFSYKVGFVEGIKEITRLKACVEANALLSEAKHLEICRAREDADRLAEALRNCEGMGPVARFDKEEALSQHSASKGSE